VTAPPSFPTLSGQGWSVHKKPIFSTIVASHVSGREVRDALYENPIWEFELTFDALDSGATQTLPNSSLAAQSLQSLMGIFMLCQGQYGTFLYTDPTDSAAVATTAFATGDGTTTSFVLSRHMGAFLEPVGWVTNLAAVTVAGSVVGGSAYGLSTPNTLVFTSPPAAGAAIGATFSYAFQCRFSDDSADFEQFMANIWKADAIKFRSVRTS
jgi:hypothetical protein